MKAAARSSEVPVVVVAVCTEARVAAMAAVCIEEPMAARAEAYTEAARAEEYTEVARAGFAAQNTWAVWQELPPLDGVARCMTLRAQACWLASLD